MNGPASPRWKSATIAIAVAAATATLLAVVPATAGGIINAQRLSVARGSGARPATRIARAPTSRHAHPV